MRKALIVFAKIPRAGQVKTRLTSLLSPEWAARIYEAFLLDALDQYILMNVPVRLYLSPPIEEIPDTISSLDVEIFEQQGEGLGARMAHAFVHTFMAGIQQAVIIGTDHPTLPTAFIEEAFNQIEAPYSISIGPSEDGGYYLLGMNEFYPHLFDGMAYSHPDVFAQTLERAEQTNAQVTVLPEWYDVDMPETLIRLIPEASDAVGLIRTRALLPKLIAAYPELNRH